MSVKIAKGNSYAFATGRKSSGAFVDLSTYECRLVIASNTDRSVILIDRPVTLLSGDNLRFLINITGAETATLTQSARYLVGVMLSDSATDYIKETYFTIDVTDSLFD